MNLKEFNDGTPSTKPWLNPVFSSLTCRNILANTVFGNLNMNPNALGTAGQVLQSDGSGNVLWGSGSATNQSLNTFNSVQFAGITSTGVVNAGSNLFKSSAVPVLSDDITNKSYVDAGLNAKLSLTGGTMLGAITSLRTNDSNIILGSNAGLLASGLNSVCIGSNSLSQGQDSVAIGLSASASQGSCVAIGNTAVANSLGSIAIGVNSLASSTSIAIGRESKAVNSNSIIINANGGTSLTSSSNNEISMKAGTNSFIYDNSGFKISNGTESTSTITGSLKTAGGLGVGGNINFGGLINGTTNGGGQFSQTNTVIVSNTTVETSLMGIGQGSLTVPANTFPAGGSYIVEMGGVMSCLNNESLTIRIYGGVSGLTLLGTIPTLVIPTSTAKWWGVSMFFTVRNLGTAGSASLSARAVYSQNVDVGNNLFGSSFHVVNTTTFDSTVANTLRITAQWGSASASNSIASAQLVLTKSY